MTIKELYRKLKEKDKNYIVTENQWGTAFTIYYKEHYYCIRYLANFDVTVH